MKKINFDTPVYALAPLAGFTDLPFRSVVKKFGVDLTVSEMISSNALFYKSAKSIQMLEKSDIEEPYIVQLAGSKPDIMRKAVEYLNGIDGIDGVDLNSGCPVPKVVSQLAGSALLNDLKLLESMVSTIKQYSNKEYTSVKMRLGFVEKNHIEIAKIIEGAGADYIAVHGRTRSGGFKAEVDYEAIAQIKQAVKIPVIANGDIDSYEKAQMVLKYTGADGLMIGRGAIGNPWIFHQLKNNQAFVEPKLKHQIILEHYDQMINFYGDHGAKIFRKHLHTYSKGFNGASVFRQSINELTDTKIMREKIHRFFSNN